MHMLPCVYIRESEVKEMYLEQEVVRFVKDLSSCGGAHSTGKPPRKLSLPHRALPYGRQFHFAEGAELNPMVFTAKL